MKPTVKSAVIKAAVVFLILVALLTYFSGTIDNYLLPHVTVTTAGESTLKYQLRAETSLEKPAAGTAVPRFRFPCDRVPETFLKPGTAIDVKVAVEGEQSELTFCDGIASVVELRRGDKGTECVAVLDKVDLQRGGSMPAEGSTVVVNSEFESARYKNVVMKSAIQDNSYVYLVTKGDDGKHYVAKAALTVIDESDFYAAVEMSADALPVVLTATKEIREGQRVIVDG